MSYVQSAKGEIESFRVLKAHWGKALFPLNCSSENFLGLAELPEVRLCAHQHACMCLYEEAVSMCKCLQGGTQYKVCIVVFVGE